MTATTQAPDALAGTRLSGVGIVRSEWVKLVTLRSTWWCLGVLAIVAAGLPPLIALALGAAGVTPGMLVELTRVFNLLTYLWYRARRLERNVPATDLQVESSALRRLLALAPDA